MIDCASSGRVTFVRTNEHLLHYKMLQSYDHDGRLRTLFSPATAFVADCP
jgi:hypothetical protein